MTDIVSALDARSGAICVVGAGGKKTTLYGLANRLDGAIVTATVRIPIFDREVATVRVTDDPVGVATSADAFPLGLVPGRDRTDRYRGYDCSTVDELVEAYDGPVLVKADGARTRELKAPNDREPQLPASADVVVPIASVHAVGKPLDADTVHRPERVAEITNLELGDRITPDAVAAVLASEAGGRKGVPNGATVRPLINKVDDADDEAVARSIAAGVHDRGDVDRVVLARMRDMAVVDVVDR